MAGLPAWLTQIKGKALRNWLTFSLGGAGLTYETLSSGVEKPTLIIGFIGMMGLPIWLGADQKNAKAVDPPIPAPLEPDPPVLIPIPAVVPVVPTLREEP